MSLDLTTACEANDFDHIRRLLEDGNNPDKIGHNGLTPLCVASLEGHLEIAKLLVENGADVNKKGFYSTFGPLYLATEGGKSKIVEYLLVSGVEADAIFGYDRKTSLMLACKLGHEIIVELLLKHGANPNATDASNRNTPLFYLAESSCLQNERIVELLSNYGANVNVTNDKDETALDIALANFNQNNVAIELLKQFGIVNSTDKLGRTALFKLCTFSNHNSIEAIKMLVQDFKADLNIRSRDGWTPLMAACDSGCDNLILEMVLGNQENINAINNYGDSALILACRRANLKTVQFLLDRGADTRILNNKGHSPVIVTCFIYKTSTDRLKILKTLVKYGADLNQSGNPNDKPLLLSILWGDLDLANCLIDLGADVTVEDGSGNKAMELVLDTIQDSNVLISFLEHLQYFGSSPTVDSLDKWWNVLPKKTIEEVIRRILPMDKSCHLMKSVLEASTSGKIRQKTRNKIFLMKNFLSNNDTIENICENGLEDLDFLLFNWKLFGATPGELENLFTTTVCNIFTRFKSFTVLSWAPQLEIISKMVADIPIESISTDNLCKILPILQRKGLIFLFNIHPPMVYIKIERLRTGIALKLYENVIEQYFSIIDLLSILHGEVVVEIME